MEKKQLVDEKVSALLNEVVVDFRQLFGNKLIEVILFGSYARGDYDLESDIDIFVLVNDENHKRHRDHIIDLEIRLTIEYGIMPTILVENKDHYDDYYNLEFLYQNVDKEGRRIYAA